MNDHTQIIVYYSIIIRVECRCAFLLLLALKARLHQKAHVKLRLMIVTWGRIARVLLPDDPTRAIAHEALVEHRVVIGALHQHNIQVCIIGARISCHICWFRLSLLLLLLRGMLGELRLGIAMNQLATKRLLSYLSVHVLFVCVCG